MRRPRGRSLFPGSYTLLRPPRPPSGDRHCRRILSRRLPSRPRSPSLFSSLPRKSKPGGALRGPLRSPTTSSLLHGAAGKASFARLLPAPSDAAAAAARGSGFSQQAQIVGDGLMTELDNDILRDWTSSEIFSAATSGLVSLRCFGRLVREWHEGRRRLQQVHLPLLQSFSKPKLLTGPWGEGLHNARRTVLSLLDLEWILHGRDAEVTFRSFPIPQLFSLDRLHRASVYAAGHEGSPFWHVSLLVQLSGP